LNIGFPFPFYGQNHSTAYISSNGFLALGSSAGASAFSNAPIPSTAVPNGVVAPFWDDLFPGSAGSVHAGSAGSPGSRVLYVEWFNVPHFSLSGSGTATFEVALHEATGEIRFQWLDTDLGNADWNLGASATAGVERQDGVVGRQLSFNQPSLTSPRAVSCTFGEPAPPPAPTITTTTLPDGIAGVAYDETLQATGGTPPYTWSLDSGSLPAGLTLDPATGDLTGTPTTATTSPFTAKVTDADSQTDLQALSITIEPAPVEPPTITTTSLADGTVGVAYAQTLEATGGTPPYAWSLASGALPGGLVLDAATGAVSGTPTTSGTYSFTAQVTDDASQSDVQVLSITIDPAPPPPLAITTPPTLPAGTQGVFYSVALAATGGDPPYTWSRTSGTLPKGLTLSPFGVISGTPTKRGNSTFTVRVRDSAGAEVSRTFSLRINRP